MSAIFRRFEWKDPSPDSFVKNEVLSSFGGARESNVVPTKGNSTQKSIECIVPMQHNDTRVRASAHFTNARSAKATASLTAKKSSIGTSVPVRFSSIGAPRIEGTRVRTRYLPTESPSSPRSNKVKGEVTSGHSCFVCHIQRCN